MSSSTITNAHLLRPPEKRLYKGHASTSKNENRNLYAHFDHRPELSQDPLLLTSGRDRHRGLSGSTGSTHADFESWWAKNPSLSARCNSAENTREDDAQSERLGIGVHTPNNRSSFKRKREGEKEGESESDMCLCDSTSGSEEEDEAVAEFDFGLSTQEEAVLQEVGNKDAEEKRREKEKGKGKGKAKAEEVAVGEIDSRSALEDAWGPDEAESSKMANEDHEATKQVAMTDPEVMRRRRIEVWTRAIVSGWPESSSGKSCAQASNDDPVMTEKELEAQRQRIKAKAQEERRKRKQEMKQQRHPPPIERKQKRKQQREDRKKHKREQEAEVVRVRKCEKELLILRASQIQGIAVPRLGEIHQKNRTVNIQAGTPPRVRVLRRARQEQELRESMEDQSAALDSDCPTASASTVVVKEEPCTQFLDHVVPEAEEDGQPNITGEEPFAVRTSGEEDGDGKFHFELVIDLNSIGKHRRNESKDSSSSLPDDAGGSMPTITKVTIALENNTEYRISVSGERPMKHGGGETQL